MSRATLTSLVLCLVLQAPRSFAQEIPPPTDPPSENAIPSEEEDKSRIIDLPLLEEMKIPTLKELLHGEPVTWIIVTEDRVVVSRPIKPRPNTLETLAKTLEELRAQRPEPDPVKRAAQMAERRKYQQVRGGFPGADINPEFLIETKVIHDIWHHEDLMLKRVDLLIEQKNLTDAYELLFALDRIDPNWPGLAERYQRLLLLDGIRMFEDNHPQAALARFEELYAINPDFPQLRAEMGKTSEFLIQSATNAQDRRQARHFLHRLAAHFPDHNVVSSWTERLTSEMEDLLSTSASKQQTGDLAEAMHLARRASVIWPHSGDLKLHFRQLGTRYQSLRVGVLVPAGARHSYPLPLDSDQRFSHLIERPLFEISDFDNTPHYRTSWFDNWIPTELGRQIQFDLRTSFDYWDSLSMRSSVAIANTLNRQLNPLGDAFNERLSGYISGIVVTSPTELQIDFSRAPLRPEALFHQLADKTVPRTRENSFFFPADRADAEVLFQRGIPEPEGAPVFHVAEVRERAYPDREEVLRGLLRGEIDAIPQLTLGSLARFENNPNWVIRQYALPLTHLIQFHPDSLPARNQELRRALLYAIDRDQLLYHSLLDGVDPKQGRVSTAPFPLSSYAASPTVRTLAPDLRVALSLALAATKQNEGELPELRMIAPPDRELTRVIEAMIERWQRAGISVRLLSTEEQAKGEWDLAYRTISMSEPLVELWPFLTLNQAARVADLQRLPGWLRQQLIDLDLTTNWEDAVRQLHQLHVNLWDEVFLIPLWEVERYMLLRRNVRRVPARPVHAYDDLEKWIVDPWFDESKP